MELGILYVLPAIMVGIVCLWWFISDRRAGDQTEDELERDKKSADDIAIRAEDIARGAVSCEEHAEKLRENQRAVEEYFGTASEAVTRAEERSRSTVELADECLAILEEAEKTKE